MSDDMSLCRRRRALEVLAGAAVFATCGPGHAALSTRVKLAAAALTVAGPPTSETGAWARTLAPALQNALGLDSPLRLRYVGGYDGVTGANRFQAQVTPDDLGALLFPGAASLAWLAGDPRVKFDASRMVAVIASISPGVMLLRRLPTARRRAEPARIAGAAPLDPAVAGLLGLDVLGIPAVPAAPGHDTMDALRAGGADGAFLQGANVPERAREMRRAGFLPFFAIGVGPFYGTPDRDPNFPDVPTWHERIAERGAALPQLVAAWRAVTAASVLDMALALPMVSSADSIAVWRRACGASLSDPSVQAASGSESLRLLAGTDAGAALGGLKADMPTQLSLRRWLAQRLDWRPS